MTSRDAELNDAPAQSRTFAFSVRSWHAAPMVALLPWVLVAVIISALLLTREYVNYAVETDLIGGFLSEALRLRQGEPLAMKFHLPFYSAMMVAFHPLGGGWFEAGLIITWLATLLAMATSYWLARDLLGWQAGIGVAIVIGSSSQFLTHGGVASSDMLFLALYQSAFLAAFRAFRDRSPIYWVATGLMIALCYLTRTNGIILMLLFAVPFLVRDESVQKFKAISLMAIGLAAGFAPWATYAWMTGSPLLPTQSHLTLATAFYDKNFNIYGGDFVDMTRDRFSNIWEVLSYDPRRIPVAYAENVARLALSLPKLVSPLILMIVLPGLIAILTQLRSRFFVLLSIITIFHVVLNCFADFQVRYFLFLVPFLGLGVWKTIELTTEHLNSAASRRIFYGFIGLCSLLSLFLATNVAWQKSRVGEREVAGAVSFVRDHIDPDNAVIVARKGSVAYHAQTGAMKIPVAGSLEELRLQLGILDDTRAHYLFFGNVEAQYRPGMALLRRGTSPVDWLVPVATGQEGGGWALYRIRSSALKSN